MESETLSAHLQAYLEHLEALRYSRQTLKGIRQKNTRLIQWLAQRQIRTPDQLQRELLEQWQRHLAGRQTPKGMPLKAVCINRCVCIARGWLKYLAEHGGVARELPETLRCVKEPRLLPGSILTHAEMKRLLSRIDTTTAQGFRNRAMFELLYSTGIRVGELLGLDVEDVDLKQGMAKVLGKGKKERMAPIGKTALRYLDSYLVAIRPFLLRDKAERALFVNHGRRMGYEVFRISLATAARQAKLDKHVSPHTFRRSCATELIRGGANMYHVKELLGHESLNTLKHYAHLTILDLKKTHAKCHPRERDVLS